MSTAEASRYGTTLRSSLARLWTDETVRSPPTPTNGGRRTSTYLFTMVSSPTGKMAVHTHVPFFVG